ncbi:hydrolase [Arthrobacter sp. BL-252-APC-1A]|uniref:hydrolase n=1 Tax=Arthrobacter sp. BL-252-APC-1A TaxID=2606622 RepID=UPI001E31D9C0|nr:hydrolase [Arthrobacter sp. BL-252-APC-1A]
MTMVQHYREALPPNDYPICVTCGTQYGGPRADCPVCLDERQYVPFSGQAWTTLSKLRSGARRASIHPQGPGVLGIGSEPKFAIGQRALLVKALDGNVLWDCVPYLDEEMIDLINAEGGLTAIAISHPHYYATMVDWAREFGVPVYLHSADREWVGRTDPALQFWDGDRMELAEGLVLYRPGVHFPGGTVMHWADDPDGLGALFSGDIIQVIPDFTHVAFMYSYPNLIPERPDVVEAAAELLAPLSYERLYGAWWDYILPNGADRIVQDSARRYLKFTRG